MGVRTRTLRCSLSVVVALVLVTSHGLSAQEMAAEEEEQAYWHVQLYQIPWERVDSLRALESQYSDVFVEKAKEAGTILDYRLLIHEMGDEYNVVEMTKYPSWAAIQEGPGWGRIAEELFDEETREAINAGYSYVYEGHGAHRDLIYTEAKEGG